MEKQQKFSFMAALFQLFMAAIVIGLWIKYRASLPSLFMLQGANALFIGFIISVLAWRHNALAWKAFAEKRDRELSSSEKNIFDENESFAGRLEKSFLQFNKALLPVVLILISALEVFLSLRLYFSEVPELVQSKSTILVPVAVFYSLSLLLFLLGKFTSGLAHNERQVFLKPVCGYLLYGSFTLFVGATCALLYHFEVEQPISWFVSCSVIFSCLLAVERMLLWLVDLYRPKSSTEVYQPVYESRILALFSQPKGVLGNLAAMVEYQFGVKVSESLFASSLKKIVLPYVCIQVLTLFALSSFTYIKPHENALKMSWGDQSFELLPPGLHITAPWPISSVERFDVQRIKELNLTPSQKFDEAEEESVIDSWDLKKYDELLNMGSQVSDGNKVTQNLAVLNVKLSYRISDVLKYRSAYIDSEKALLMSGRKVLSQALLESSFSETLQNGLGEFTAQLKEKLSALADAEYGIEIIDVAIVNFQPPADVAPIYQDVYAASQDKLRFITEAEKYNSSLLNLAELEADKMLKNQKAETVLKKMLLEKELEAFKAQSAMFRKMPILFRAVAQMNALEGVLRDVRKVVNLTEAKNEVITLELKKATPDLLELE
ncbi:MAG: SPFH domain-containing protein [Lentisphaeraceae bacterium]|nr:SPFH domain-containing protein [Lentisphaeraceae bacterium]